MSTTLTLQKLKDEESRLVFTARLSRVVIAQDEDSDDVSTLVVDTIEEGAAVETKLSSKSVPPAQRLLMKVVAIALEEAGKSVRPIGENGPQVQAVAESAIRTRYYARIAEQAEPGEDKKTIVERQKKAFKRSLEGALKSTLLVAGAHEGERIVWLA